MWSVDGEKERVLKKRRGEKQLVEGMGDDSERTTKPFTGIPAREWQWAEGPGGPAHCLGRRVSSLD